MLSKLKAKRIMESRGLFLCDAFLLLVASENQKGESIVNPSLSKRQVWKMMIGALDEIKRKKGGGYNLNGNSAHKIIGQNILREFGNDGF